MNNQIFFIQINDDGNVINITHDNHIDDKNWYEVIVDPEEIQNFENNYSGYKYDKKAKALIGPDDFPTETEIDNFNSNVNSLVNKVTDDRSQFDSLNDSVSSNADAINSNANIVKSNKAQLNSLGGFTNMDEVPQIDQISEYPNMTVDNAKGSLGILAKLGSSEDSTVSNLANSVSNNSQSINNDEQLSKNYHLMDAKDDLNDTEGFGNGTFSNWFSNINEIFNINPHPYIYSCYGYCNSVSNGGKGLPSGLPKDIPHDDFIYVKTISYNLSDPSEGIPKFSFKQICWNESHDGYYVRKYLNDFQHLHYGFTSWKFINSSQIESNTSTITSLTSDVNSLKNNQGSFSFATNESDADNKSKQNPNGIYFY